MRLSQLVGLRDERVELDFKQRSLSVKGYGFKGINWFSKVPNLHAKMPPSDCMRQVKSGCLKLSLCK